MHLKVHRAVLLEGYRIPRSPSASLRAFALVNAEEIAWRSGFITDAQFFAAAKAIGKSDYGQYLLDIQGYRNS